MKLLEIKQNDGSVWAVPVAIIALHRARFCAESFHGSVRQSLIEDTVPLFKNNPQAIIDWVESNMDWDMLSQYSFLMHDRPLVFNDFKESIASGEKRISEI